MPSKVFYEKGKKYNCTKNGKPYYRMTVTIAGKRHEVYGDGEKDAKAKAEELKTQSAMGYDLAKKNAKVGSVINYWLFNVKRVDKNLKASSFARYECAVRNHIMPYPIATATLSQLDSATMQAYVTSLYEDHGLSGPNIASVVKVWRLFCKWAQEEGYIIKNPCRNLSLPGAREKGKKKIVTFSAEERATLLSYMRDSKYCYDTVIELAFATGMRQGELLGLRWEDVDLLARTITVSRSTAVVVHINKEGTRDRYREVWDTKTENSNRVIPLLPSTAKMLETHRVKQRDYFESIGKPQPEYVFTTETGALIDQTSFGKSYTRLLRRANIPHRKFHAIRHTFATEAIRKGVDVKDLAMLLGHSDVSTTYIYVQPNEETKRNAIEKMGQIM